MQGIISAYHLINPPAKALQAVDGEGRKYPIKKALFIEMLLELKAEAARLKSLGLE